jgi:hypothetical protein
MTVAEEPIGPPPRDAERVVASLRPKFRQCFERGRADDDPYMNGKLRLITRVAENGSVTSAKVAARDGLSSGVAECIARQMARATFAPRTAPASFEVPVHFIDSGR